MARDHLARISVDTIHIAMAADRRFAMPLAVTVRSILRTLAPGRCVALHLLDCGIPDGDKARLQASWRDDRLHVVWYHVDRHELRAFPVMAHFSRAMYARLFVSRLLPRDIGKVMYLDADLLVLADIGLLWDEPFDDAACLAVPDVSCPWVDGGVTRANYERFRLYLGDHPIIPNYRALGFSPSDPYFNSGVLVMDLDRWRADDISQRALDCLETHRRHLLWPDQYALNVALHGRWRPLDLAWNQGAHIFRYPDWTHSPFDLASLARCRFAPHIVHFTTADKPWVRPEAHPFSPQFFECLDLTAWSGWRPSPLRSRLLAKLGRTLTSLWT